MTAQQAGGQIDVKFSGPTFVDNTSGWTFIAVPDSAEYFGTRRHVKVEGTVNGQPIAATLMPSGDGVHWLPLKAATRKALGGAEPGQVFEVHLSQRLS